MSDGLSSYLPFSLIPANVPAIVMRSKPSALNDDTLVQLIIFMHSQRA